MSFSDLPLLYYIIGGFLEMVLSNGWFSIKLHLCINVFFKFLTPGWYVATNGNICSWVFFFCFKADCLPAKDLSDNILSNKFLGYPRARRCVLRLERDSLEIFFPRNLFVEVCNSFAFDKTSFDTWWVTGSVMCVLKYFSRFIVSFYVKDSVFLESLSFINNCVKECDFLVWNFSCKF